MREVREALQTHQTADDGSPSTWLIAMVRMQTLRTVVRGQWQLARVLACWPQLKRFLLPSRRTRRQLEGDTRAWLAHTLVQKVVVQLAA